MATSTNRESTKPYTGGGWRGRSRINRRLVPFPLEYALYRISVSPVNHSHPRNRESRVRGNFTVSTNLSGNGTRSAIERMLDAAVWAPNHRLTEPWRFFVFQKDSPARLEAAELAHEFTLQRTDNPRRAESAKEKVLGPPYVIYVYCIPGPNEESIKENYASVCSQPTTWHWPVSQKDCPSLGRPAGLPGTHGFTRCLARTKIGRWRPCS